MNVEPFISPRPRNTRSPACHCPRCVWPYLHRLGEPGERQLVCDSCGHAWRFEHGELHPVVTDKHSVSTS
jgi:hypothetical protein